ncbi:hypothetical protein NV379_21225 [Paenibacillus sp. N1-5-1-14]|uniref:hypothetical protein n=1 Tax=Paenibacillus radicibacter TaxID=2972488 RepID=UPI002158DAE2|nr:hypothetical protein [Paenibacillus radicibacter]MCR8645180.1 hypothetical protein [Paenibacillus radicibacter]
MQEQFTTIIGHIARSHREVANIVGAKGQTTKAMSQLVHHIPSHNPDFGKIDAETVLLYSSDMTRNVVAYVNALAELEEALAESLEVTIKGLNSSMDDE